METFIPREGESVASLIVWIIFWAILVLFLLFAVAGASVAFYLLANNYWIATGQVLQSKGGGLTSVLTQCTNLTFSLDQKKVRLGKKAAFYNTCMQPRSACEVAVCGADGVCYPDLADGAQCSVTQDCIDLFNSTLYGCGSDCLCTNSSDWYLSGNLDVSGDLVSYITTCSNETYASQQSKINGGKVVSIYNPCPQPRSTCEASFCGGDGLCSFVLSNNSECASTQDCTNLYNSTAYTCGSDCLCTNSSQASFAFIKFTPANVTMLTIETYDPTKSYYFYRAIGDVIEIEMQITFSQVNLTANNAIAFEVDISNLPYALISTATEYGIGYGSIISGFTSVSYDFIGIEGYSISSTIIEFDIFYGPTISIPISPAMFFNGRFVGRFT